MSVLAVEDLRVRIAGAEAVRGVSFSIAQGERVGLVGESGSGKSLTALAIMGLLPDGASAMGRATFDDASLLDRPERDLAALRGGRMAMVFQDPMSALNPVMRVGNQIAEVLRRHTGAHRRDAAARAVELMDRVQIPDAGRKARAYPHELSGGQRQRVMIAMAVACGPKLLIADEPTTALDATVQADVLRLLTRLADESDMALLLITHDLPVVAAMCDRVLVLYGGTVVETGPTPLVLNAPRHRYTAGLTSAVPAPVPADESRDQPLPTIPGAVPALGAFPSGCPFRDRCGHATDVCAQDPPRTRTGEREFACWHPVPEHVAGAA